MTEADDARWAEIRDLAERLVSLCDTRKMLLGFDEREVVIGYKASAGNHAKIGRVLDSQLRQLADELLPTLRDTYKEATAVALGRYLWDAYAYVFGYMRDRKIVFADLPDDMVAIVHAHAPGVQPAGSFVAVTHDICSFGNPSGFEKGRPRDEAEQRRERIAVAAREHGWRLSELEKVSAASGPSKKAFSMAAGLVGMSASTLRSRLKELRVYDDRNEERHL